MRALLFIILFTSIAAHATQTSALRCQLQLEEVRQISGALASVPTLRQYVLSMIEDPLIPAPIRTLVRRTLIERQASVVNLTERLRAESGISERTIAFATLPGLPRSFYPNASKTSNEQFSELKLPDKLWTIYVSDGEVTEEQNGLMTLVHELAHIRFTSFLERRYEEICKRLPSSFTMFLADGTCLILGQMIDMMGEKFAFETQYQTPAGAYSRYFSSYNWIWLEQMTKQPKQQFSQEVGNSVNQIYNYSIPQVRAAAVIPLSQILLGGKLLKQIDRATKIVCDPRESLPNKLEFQASLDFVKFIEISNPVTDRKLSKSLAAIGTSFSNLRRKFGKARAEELLRALHRYSKSVDGGEERFRQAKHHLRFLLRASN